MTTNASSIEPKLQRAVIFQGDGSLAAFEAGAFRAFYEMLTEENGIQDRDESLFDIIVGTSMGAVNAAIVVSHVINNKTWKDCSEKLIEFWKDISSESSFDNPFFTGLWNYLHRVIPTAASSE